MKGMPPMHLVRLQQMQCLHCRHVWTDFPGELGANYKDGCPRCHSVYWSASEKTR